MNVVFISPHFPLYFHNFCSRLKIRGVNVLGIGDANYSEISNETKDSLSEYYRVNSLENYDEVYKAVAYYISKYGRIDFVESQNEYWLETDARIRTDFNINSGTKYEDLAVMKYKSKMKDIYKSIGLNAARYCLVDTFENALAFVEKVGYPIVVKPDNGVGASSTYKLKNQSELEYFFATKDNRVYIMEEYVNGHVETYDGITDSNKNILIANSTIMLNSIMDNVNENCDTAFCNRFVAGSDIEEVGKKVVQAFDTRSRFFHFEFFRLDADKEGLGKKGDLVGLEVNMRAPGAYMPDMINFSYETDVYTIWADMLIYDKCFMDVKQKYLVAYIGRRDGIDYMLSNDQINQKYGDLVMLDVDVPEALSAAMGNHVFMVRAENQEHLDFLIDELLRRSDGRNWR
ncbi:MAG TPA: ATP-grasp domain-containing protein [Candidatus Erysipelatoclostridium merdavium]|uniref:ATP-grasp domain-containing protein n=1 Tax=Candidatus Erysipelatoclostridium merdavium TaxID=2838566 RepID=A0A9D1XKK9_9FIRM|nr:ATP-grasp domain-containing protein [uncultured Thomasclavelia sp.]HIX80940.1 ATP-grasp domain-containing protein [Candidatus Erysipelatoclostridium merdavium]